MRDGTFGVDASLLPVKTNAHYDVAKAKRTIGTSRGKTIQELLGQLKSGESITIPPGVYISDPLLLREVRDVTICAQGVTLIFLDYTKTAIAMENCHGVIVNGLAIDFAEPANTQGDVLEAGENSLIWRAHQGYPADLLDDRKFSVPGRISPAGEGYRQGKDRPFMDIGFSLVEPFGRSGIYRLHGGGSARIQAGDMIVFRGKPAHVNRLTGCSGIRYIDVTILGGSGFGLFECDGDGGTLVERMLIMPGPRPAGADMPRLVSTCDAVHCANMRKGVTVRNSLFEKMTDDAANIHGYFGLVNGYDASSGLLGYTFGNATYKTLCAPFLEGDEALLFAPAEGCALHARVVSQTRRQGDALWEMVLKLPDRQSVPSGAIIQNLSASGSGFMIENCLVENNRSRGILVKAPNGGIRSCTFRDNGMSAILVKPEIPDGWGECGFTQELSIEGNDIVQNGYFTGSELHSAVSIQGDSPGSGMRHGRITLLNNRIIDRYTRHALAAADVAELRMVDNWFGSRIRDYQEFSGDLINPLYPDDLETPVCLRNVEHFIAEGNIAPPSASLCKPEKEECTLGSCDY